MTGKKSKTVPDGFISVVIESNCKPNKLEVEQGRWFYNKLMKYWLGDNDILMQSTYNEGKSTSA